MQENQDQLKHLSDKLDMLLKRHTEFASEIESLRNQIQKLSDVPSVTPVQTIKEPDPVVEAKPENTPVYVAPKEAQTIQNTTAPPHPQPTRIQNGPKPASTLEKFIGENLANKIGILITVIGVAIGAKYAIDHQMINPLTRIILGYFMGIGLMVFAIRLRRNYENYSAVLLSGSMAILYLITFFAYSFYRIIPQVPAFSLMVIFTAFTVYAALSYNKQVIAHIGLVGAYAVPFLLSDGSGNEVIMFTYISIINTGILIIAWKKFWQLLNYISFGFTWLIYAVWLFFGSEQSQDLSSGWIFCFVNFAIFYCALLAYKIYRREKIDIQHIIFLSFNALLFYGFGYELCTWSDMTRNYQGVFTLMNAILHFAVAVMLHKRSGTDRNAFYFISGLVLVFITIAIPVQLDGNWVTMVWCLEAALLFRIGRTKGVIAYERMSYPLIVLALLSLISDWMNGYNLHSYMSYSVHVTPIANIHFFTSACFVAAIGFIYYLNRKQEYLIGELQKMYPINFLNIALPILLIASVYFAFRLEIANYWVERIIKVSGQTQEFNEVFIRNDAPMRLKNLWLLNYSLLFLALLAILNLSRIRNRILGMASVVGMLFFLLGFLIGGLYAISELREIYFSRMNSGLGADIQLIVIRYISLLFPISTLLVLNSYIKQKFFEKDFSIAFDLILHLAVLWIATSEMIHWMDMSDIENPYKRGVSILWGVYAFMLLAMGIWRRKPHLRIAAISLTAITLVKLFLYDIAQLDTISKTILFISIGVLLLLISFLYNKYKHLISDDGKM